jgi:hypothetical protein
MPKSQFKNKIEHTQNTHTTPSLEIVPKFIDIWDKLEGSLGKLVSYPNIAPHGPGTASLFISLATIERYPLGLELETLLHDTEFGSAVIGVESTAH